MQNIDRIYNFDTNGNSGGVYLYETSDGDYDLVKDFLQTNVLYPIPLSFAEMPYHMSGKDTDLSMFFDGGYSGLNFSMTGGANVYHTMEDSFANINKNSVYNLYKTVSALASHSVSSDFAHNKSSTMDGVYFPVFKDVVVLIPDYISVIIGIVATLFGAVTIAFAGKRKVKARLHKITLTVFGILTLGTVFFLNTFSYMFWIPAAVLALTLLFKTLELPQMFSLAVSAVSGIVISTLYYTAAYMMYFGMGPATLPIIILVAAIGFSGFAVPILSSGKK